MDRLLESSFAVALIAAFVLPTAAFSQQAQSKTKWPECFCTDREGTRRELGDIICLTINERSYEAKCVMAQNNPFWRDLNRGCLSSKLQPPLPTVPQTPFPREFASLTK